jgi:putative transcriptional regulator
MKRKRSSTKSSTFGRRIVAGLTDLRDALRSDDSLEKVFTARTVEVVEPEQFNAARVRALREDLQFSQAVFAQVLGVSKVLTQSWEQGIRKPSAMACRLLAEIERDPTRWRKLVAILPTERPHRRKSA